MHDTTNAQLTAAGTISIQIPRYAPLCGGPDTLPSDNVL